jgi:hypothetical protein
VRRGLHAPLLQGFGGERQATAPAPWVDFPAARRAAKSGADAPLFMTNL